MPTSARKSSIGGNRRGPLKAHVPFRGDNPEVGKKTGIAVEFVQRRADGFEAFEDIIRQADKRTPPKVKTKKRKMVVHSPVEDEYGEMSMDMDDSNPNSPMAFFTNARALAARQNTSRVESSSRITALDFDRLPSPRPRSSLPVNRRQSMANGSAPGPSNLSKSAAVPESGSSPDRVEVQESGIDVGFDNDGPQDSSIHDASPRQTSFLQMDQDDDEDDTEQDMAETPVQISKRSKGKERARELEQDQQEDHEVEREIVQGLEDVELDHYSDTEMDVPPSNKKVKMANEKPKRARTRKTQQVQQRSPTPDGVRRGKRLRYGPLEWWRQEKVVYGRRESGLTLVPHIKEIRRVPKDAVLPLSKPKRRRGTAAPRSKSQTAEKAIVFNPEDGWDDDTGQQGVVVDFVTKQEVQRRIAFTARMVEPQAAANDDWFFQKVFGDGDFIAAGQLIIPPKGRKPSKGTKDNTYIFYVIEGAVNLKVHETSLILATGGMFMVPRGNTYFIENIADRDAKLFFTQARKIAAGEEEHVPHMHLGSRRSSEALQRTPGTPSQGRSSSVGAKSVALPTVRVNGTRVASKRAASTKI